MAKKIHIFIQAKDLGRLRSLAIRNNLSLSAVADVIGIYYANYGRKYNLNKENLIDMKETTLKIRTEKNPFIEKNKSIYYSTCLFYYFNNQALTDEEREDAKIFNKRIAVELRERQDPNALYNAVVRMNYRAEKEKHKCKK